VQTDSKSLFGLPICTHHCRHWTTTVCHCDIGEEMVSYAILYYTSLRSASGKYIPRTFVFLIFSFGSKDNIHEMVVVFF
jgi:hypothetical protein